MISRAACKCFLFKAKQGKMVYAYTEMKGERAPQSSHFPTAFIQIFNQRPGSSQTGLLNPRIDTEIPSNPVCMTISGLCTLHILTPL